MTNRLSIIIFWLTSASGLLGAPAPPLSIEELSQHADLILHGTVLSQSCQQDAAGRIYTRIEFRVEEAWKGRPSRDPCLIVHSGGRLGRQQLTVPNQVVFNVGDEAVVFLVLNRRGEGVCVGMAQGKFRIQRDPATGEKLAIPGSAESSQDHEPGCSRSLLTLTQLRQRVCAGKP
jgi:hypothetical protein